MTFALVETMTTEGVPETATEHMVPTRDGVHLATDVYLPEGRDGRTYSAVLVRTCYDKTSRYTALKFEAEYYNARGFVMVVQDVRGKFNSTVIMVQAGDETISRVAQLVQQQAKSVGLTVEIRSLQPLVFEQAGYDATKRKGIDMMLSTNFNATADPLEPMGFTYLPGQPYNYTEFDNPKVTNLLTEARQSFDAKERAKKVVEAQVIFEQDSAVIPVVSTNTATFLNNRLTGAVTSFAYWSLASMTYIGSAK
ncbi:hypothetical protein GCM10022237_05590 [Nocardioides ginsengisoli]|uniref:CocE/NonD family hydrolase n=1 Tax=Nocardioides ginsengisoli TaxID=363868 RepID=A0ABW3VVT3_9ACTN